MNTPFRKILWAFVFLIAIAASFLLGRWNGALKESLEHEANYPWALHKKLSNIDARCEKLNVPTVGKFLVQQADSGETLLIATLNTRTKMVNTFAINSDGQVASDSWPVDCQ